MGQKQEILPFPPSQHTHEAGVIAFPFLPRGKVTTVVAGFVPIPWLVNIGLQTQRRQSLTATSWKPGIHSCVRAENVTTTVLYYMWLGYCFITTTTTTTATTTTTTTTTTATTKTIISISYNIIITISVYQYVIQRVSPCLRVSSVLIVSLPDNHFSTMGQTSTTEFSTSSHLTHS